MSSMDIEKAVFDLPRGPGLASAASLCMRESSVRGDIGNKSLVLPELVLQKKAAHIRQDTQAPNDQTIITSSTHNS